jgi:hypothetical protein
VKVEELHPQEDNDLVEEGKVSQAQDAMVAVELS